MTEKTPHKPIFADIFGSAWVRLPKVMHDHYAIRPHSGDVVVATGTMKISMSPLAKFMAPFFKLTGTLVPRASDNVKVTVHFTSDPKNGWMCFDRQFIFEDGETLKFFSTMQPIGQNRIIEWTGSGIGWRAAFSFENDQVLLTHKGYCIKFFGQIINFPVSWLVGIGTASERATSKTGFDMEMTLAHPLWGLIYGYSGHFEITRVALDE